MHEARVRLSLRRINMEVTAHETIRVPVSVLDQLRDDTGERVGGLL